MRSTFLFDKVCNGPAVGIYAFQDRLFHGISKPERPVNRLCRLYRNTFNEPPIIFPYSRAVLAARQEVFEELSPLMKAQVFETFDEFLFRMPYVLGRNYLEIGKMAAWPEKFIEDKSVLLHPVTKGTGVRYVAFDPVAIRTIEAGSLANVEIVLPYAEIKEAEEGELIKDGTLLDRLGMVRTAFGIQVSERMYEKILPHLLTPWYVTAHVLL